MVLSYSRKGYSEAVSRQNTETFLRCLENGLRGFGGVPDRANKFVHHDPKREHVRRAPLGIRYFLRFRRQLPIEFCRRACGQCLCSGVFPNW